MPKFTMDILTVKVGYSAARRALTELPDAELIARLEREMFPTIEDRAWDPHEPEHDGLAEQLRQQANHDLDVLYAGTKDSWCDDHLAIGFTASRTTNSRPALAVLYGADDDPEDWDTYRDCNPVVRLRALRVCDEIMDTVPGMDVPAMAEAIARNRIAYTGSTVTTDWANIPWTTVAGVRVYETTDDRDERF